MRQTSPPEVRALSILHTALFMGQFIFGIIALVLVHFINISSASLLIYSKEIMILSLVVSVICYFAGNILFRKKLEQVNEDYKPLQEKLNDYRAASILRWALLEFSALFSMILFLLTNNFIIIIIAGVLILLFFSSRPTLQKITSDLNISEGEIEQMR